MTAFFVCFFCGGGGGGVQKKEVNYRWQFVLTKLLLGEILLDGKQLHMCQLVLYAFHAILVLLTVSVQKQFWWLQASSS